MQDTVKSQLLAAVKATETTPFSFSLLFFFFLILELKEKKKNL